MPATPNLAVQHVREQSTRPEIVGNAGFDSFDAALTENATGGITVDNSNAASIGATAFVSNFFFPVSAGSPAPTARSTITTPAIKRGIFCPINNLAVGIKVQAAGQLGGAPIVGPGQAGVLTCDGVNVRGRVAITEGFGGRTEPVGALLTPGDV